ncbi:hypothetical protein DH2020_006735 [Rehmannia glutinosa]|uniref:non-specific serine/threonine protein kinase n=1 Tax=Rehmannia glutinosa TaxID=99300 RepID=A0ABR0XKA5_REHGL
MDIVDLLLGWAMVPDIVESDKRVIMDSFLQFQKHWVNNMQFSLGLLSKFLGDLDVLLQDGSPGTPQQFKRLLALLSCFCTVLQSLASGLLEINLLEQLGEPFPRWCLFYWDACLWSEENLDGQNGLRILGELQLLKCKLEKNSVKGDELKMTVASKSYSKSELVVLIKFNLKVLLSCVSLKRGDSSIERAEVDALYVIRAEKLVNFLTDKFDPFHLPIQSVKLQVALLKALERLAAIEFMSKCTMRKQNSGMSSPETLSGTCAEEENVRNLYPAMVFGYLRRYAELLMKALDASSPLAVKVEALKWMHKFCENIINIYRNFKAPFYPCQAVACWKIIQDLLFSILFAASDREPEVRSLVATVLEMLLRAKIIHPMHFPIIAETILEKLGDPEKDIKDAYLKLLSHVLPVTIYICGLRDCRAVNTCQPRFPALADRSFLHWKQVFALKQLSQQLHSQQLVSILSYISQRWKVPLSSWIQRLVHTCRSKKHHPLTQPEETETFDANGSWWDIKVEDDILERICSVNRLAGAWWAIHEAARFCITTRLRTNLGGPTQTFAALERMLLDISHVLQLETEQNDGNLNIIGSYAHLLPMRLLLEFVEALKKNVYNAYEGSIILPHASRTSSLFFRANKKVCEEWFSRISEPMMDAGLALQCHDATIHYCTIRLQDISNIVASALTDKSRIQVSENLQNIRGRYAGDILRIIQNLALALCKNHEPEALVGLQKWATMAFSSLFADTNQGPSDNKNWGPFSLITGLVYQAGGQHEKAAAHFIHLLQTEESLTSMGSDGVQFAIARIIESYTSISDWKSLESWLLELQTIRAKYVGKSYSGALTTAGNEINSIQALARFDEDDFQAAWSYLDLTPKSSNELTLDPKLALQRSEQMLLQGMLLHNEGKVEKVPYELQKAKLMLEETFSVLPLDGLVEAAPHVNQLYCISAFEEGIKLGDSQGKSFQSLLSAYIRTMQFPCNQVHQDCSMWLKVLRVSRNTHPTSPVTLELSVASDSHENVLKAKACLKLSKWLQGDCLGENLERIVLEMQDDFKRSELSSPGKEALSFGDDNQGSESGVSLIIEELVGTARKSSTLLCPTMGKSWMLYASWCYTQARASVSSNGETALHSCSFSPILATEIQPQRFVLTEEEKLRVKDVILQLIRERSDKKELHEESGECSFAVTECTHNENDLKPLLQKVADLIEAAAGAPGTEDCGSDNLSDALSSQLQKCFVSANITLDEAKVVSVVADLVDVWCDVESKYKYVSYTLRAMLYVLHILVNYGVELKDILEPALAKVPLLPWQEITPQLFARLSSHPDKVVRMQLEMLLVMLAKLSPWSLIYPTLVDANSLEKEPSEELQKIHGYLNRLYPRLVQDAQLMIKELENVTVLWEELWLGTLHDLHADVMRRINLLKEEAARIAENTTLTHGEKNKINAAKYSAMMAPIVVVLERRLTSTSRKPETPHEICFLRKEVLDFFWGSCPQLASLLSSNAPMPGLEKQIMISEPESGLDSLNQEIVTIAYFSEELAILPTKTKPKKLIIVGSDGLKYTYLLKGREDLRLDARIMQLLQSVNGFLQSSSATRGGHWASNRAQLQQLSALGADTNAVPPPVPRPSDMFYGKIIPALKEKGIRRELWCASEGFKAFSSKLKRFSGSVAAMSIVGHILGLGDRHLDNILIDFCTGDIVHIDYNVCFDKGQRLKIPEIVPFRLTQTIEAALGLTGIEGSFRADCEAVLGVLRKNKDIILMLLEVFVWDPLVEWTRANFHDDAAVVGEERKGMELAVSLSLFASRVQEIRVPLQEHHDLLLSTLPAIEAAMEVREVTQQHAIVMEKGREAASWIEQHGRILDALRSSSIPEIKSRIKLTGSEEALSLSSAVLAAGVPLTVVPEPTQIQCHEIDREVSQLVAEMDNGLSSAVASLQMYSLALQRILPLNYLSTSPVHGWAQLLLSLNHLSSDVISVARRQGAELVNNGHIDRFGSAKRKYDDLCLKVTKYAADIERLEEECAELVLSIGPESESKAKERLLSAFMNYMQLAGLKSKDESIVSGPVLHEGTMNTMSCGQIEEKKERFLYVLDTAVSNLFSDAKHRIHKSLDSFAGERNTNSSLLSDLGSFICEFEEQIENCVLVIEFLDELKCLVGLDICDTGADANRSNASRGNWASIFKTSILLCKGLAGNVTEVVVPSVIKSVISFNSDVMDIFGSISQIRGSVDSVLDQLIQVELERVSLSELESNYFVKVGLITEQQLALEEAAVKGRDHLSWEEAEELASQEEACRLQSLVTAEPEKEPHVLRRKALLANLVDPFSELESVDQALMSSVGPVSFNSHRISSLVDSINSGCSISEYIWRFSGLLRSHAFFIWKVFMVDLLLDVCTHDVATSFDQNLGFDQLVDIVKKKLRNQFQEHISKYLKDRVAPIFLTRLDREIKILRQKTGSHEDRATDIIQTDLAAVRRVQLMLEEYCNAHETFRAARSAVSIMKRQINELKDALLKTSLEIAQMEWMYNINLRPLENTRLISHKYLANDDNLLPVILHTSRPKLLESIQSSVAKMARSLECLQSCDGTSVTAEGKLERAMSWACGGPNSSSAGNAQARNSGIPPEFHDHLIKRRKLLHEAHENASDIMKVCISLLEFEASRDGMFRTTSGTDGGMWQQSNLSAITKLDVTYHSFIRQFDIFSLFNIALLVNIEAEKEWKLAQSNMEAASSGLVSATNELSVASVRAKTASGDMQSTLLAMRESAYEASVALSSYGQIVGGHNALTSECGSMLEEVLAITEGLHDVHSLGKEAAALHSSLMEELSEANAVLIPLESLLSKDIAAITDAMATEKETKLEIAPFMDKPYSSLIIVESRRLYECSSHWLARAAGLHAGNLHKALEGVGESLQVRSQDIDPLRADLAGSGAEYDTQESEVFIKSDVEDDGASVALNELALPDSGWISPPESISGDSAESGATSAEASIADSFNGLDISVPVSVGSNSQEKGDYPLSSVTEVLELPHEETNSEDKQESSDVHLVRKDEESVLNKDIAEEELRKLSFTNVETVSRAHMGKNAYAVSLLRRVEMKLDGRDITDNREISIAEQVDFLLRQSTNIDNLCNMYEGCLGIVMMVKLSMRRQVGCFAGVISLFSYASMFPSIITYGVQLMK